MREVSFVMAGRKARTGPREALPDDRLRAVFAPEVPAIHVFLAREGMKTWTVRYGHHLQLLSP
jgi:hypothetical protein